MPEDCSKRFRDGPVVLGGVFEPIALIVATAVWGPVA
jgi:hypothetical protein